MTENKRDQTLLIVDDTPDNIRILMETLKHDYKIIAATNGEKALKSAGSAIRPDLILLDIMMPGMDGYEVCRRLKGNPETSDIPVIFITARGHVDDETRGLELGAVDFIIKPFSPPVVKARINTHLTLKAALQEAEKAKKHAEASNRAKSKFLANMNHELRTPLNSILGYAQLFKNDREITEKVREGIDIIHESGNHLLTLINDILDLSKIEAGKMELHPEKIFFHNLLNSVAGIIRMRLGEKPVHFIYEPNPDLPKIIRADAVRLRQILLNLLGNAIKFTDKGSVSLRVESTRFTNTTCRIRFEIEDTGVGIKPDELEKIFMPFEQVGDSSRQAEGTGLGLAISSTLTRLMGTAIHVKSEINKGSLFWFEAEFPIGEEQVNNGFGESMIITGYQGDGLKILIVDDKKENRRILRDSLNPLGFISELAKSGHECLLKIADFMPDLILMDLIMPEMDGFKTVERIRKIEGCERIPVIAVSAGFLDLNPQELESKGIDDFLPKPVDMNTLYALLKKHLKLKWICRKDSLLEIGEETGKETNGRENFKETEIIGIVSPSPDELERLYELAFMGIMDEVVEYVIHLEKKDARYQDFCHKIKYFADIFDDHAMMNFIEKHMILKD